jgi:hypothetical protein
MSQATLASPQLPGTHRISNAGPRLAWYIDPRGRTLPGFTLPLRALLARASRRGPGA